MECRRGHAADTASGGLVWGEVLAARRIIVAELAGGWFAADEVADVGVLAVFAVAALGARLPALEALAVVLEAVRLLAVAAARRAGFPCFLNLTIVFASISYLLFMDEKIIVVDLIFVRLIFRASRKSPSTFASFMKRGY